ncbi:MAG: ubiquitin-like protein Pup [Candidatus Nanopelagicales bacterium]
MASREQSERSIAPQQRDEQVVDVAAASVIRTNELDALLDEIDGVLETNAEEFVRSYVQKGGE